MTVSKDKKTFWRGIGKSLGGAFVLLFWDVAYTGSFGASFLICPIWFLVSIVKSTTQRPGWTLALVRLAIPAITLWLVMANDTVQRRIATENAEKVIAACEEFHASNSKYPETLGELVPQYMQSIPRAKYCLSFWGEFWYLNSREMPSLTWYVVPPYGRKFYDFEDKQWGYLD